MKRQLRKFVLNAVLDTPFEHMLRTTYVKLSPAKKDKYDRQMGKLMARVLNSRSNCIDVGCYRGEVLREMMRLSPDGQHFAFEPVPRNFNYLAEKFTSANIFNSALSDYTGESSFQYVSDRPALSGLRKVDYPETAQEVEEIKVKVDRLDNVIPDGISVDFIKIDVEGAELPVLRGGATLIQKSKPMIVFEHGRKKAQAYNAIPEQIFDLLSTEFHLSISVMERWLNGYNAFDREEFRRHVYEGLDFCFIAYST